MEGVIMTQLLAWFVNQANEFGAQGVYEILAIGNAVGLVIIALTAYPLLRFAYWCLAHESDYLFTTWRDAPHAVRTMYADYLRTLHR
jgi:hypothetical protein